MVELSVFIGVGGWGCPSTFNMNLIGILICALCKNPHISTSAADTTTFLIVLHSVSIGPFIFGEHVFFWMVAKMVITRNLTLCLRHNQVSRI